MNTLSTPSSSVLVSIVAILLASLPSCNAALDMDNYKQAVKSGFVQIPEAIQVESLFGEADHSISYSGSNAPKKWNTEVFFAGRYSLRNERKITSLL